MGYDIYYIRKIYKHNSPELKLWLMIYIYISISLKPYNHIDRSNTRYSHQLSSLYRLNFEKKPQH